MLIGEKSAEAIVANGNEPRIETVEVSQGSEGLNVGLSRIRQGGSNFEFASLILNKDRGMTGVKSGCSDTRRTAVYETRTHGGVRGALADF